MSSERLRIGISRTIETTEVREIDEVEMFCAIHEVRQIEVGDVVPDYHIRVNLLEELGPL